MVKVKRMINTKTFDVFYDKNIIKLQRYGRINRYQEKLLGGEVTPIKLSPNK